MTLNKSLMNKFILIAVFIIAMAYLESAVVVYLRAISYPEGFHFPLKIMPVNIYCIEVGREFATIVMLIILGYLCGNTLLERFLYFILCFGIWDIFYYVWLKIFLNWPVSLLENDLLFLIPGPWVGPVAAPLLVSFTMIITAILSLYLQAIGFKFKIEKEHALLTILGCFLILTAFLGNVNKINLLENSNPNFQWEIFLIGEIILIFSVVLFFYKNINKSIKLK